MKLLTKSLIITSLSLAFMTQVQADGRHDGGGNPKYQDHHPQALQVGWNGHRDGRISHRERKIHRHHHKHHHDRHWRHRSHDRYSPRKHFRRHYDRPTVRYYYGRPGHRYYDYGHSSGTIIFRW